MSKTDIPCFSLGQRVTWMNRGRTHIGVIVEVVDPGRRSSKYRDSYGTPSARRDTNYVISEAGRLYFPPVKNVEHI